MSHLLMPYVASADGAVGQGRLCGMNEGAARFARLWESACAEQGRLITCDALLVAVAQAHAEYLHGRTPEQLLDNMHMGEGGSTANQRVRAGGYRLLDWHRDGNTVESATRCAPDAAVALALLLDSPQHRSHLLGQGFYAPSNIYGVGWQGNDWVILACPAQA